MGRRPSAGTGILLARADGPRQRAAIGDQVAGRVGFILRVDDFAAVYDRMRAAGVEFVGSPRTEPYGRVVVFLDVVGNRWDLVEPAERRHARVPGSVGGWLRGEAEGVRETGAVERSPAVAVHGLRKRFGPTLAVDGIDLIVPAVRCSA